jgi:hypothetical protein
VYIQYCLPEGWVSLVLGPSLLFFPLGTPKTRASSSERVALFLWKQSLVFRYDPNEKHHRGELGFRIKDLLLQIKPY